MTHGRMLAVHDISCVGRCSLTTALPIISSLGIECSVLPTAVLSTHTGGFKGFTYRDLTEDIVPIKEHWKSLGLTYDAFYTGFLGSFEQIDLVGSLIEELSNERTTVYVDPVMGDNGNLYTVFDSDFPKGMRRLCEKADVLMPNLTELCFMLGMEFRSGPYTWDYIDSVFKEAEVFGLKKIVITGVSFEAGKVGAVFKDYETGEKGQVMRDVIEGYYHGTGDVFGSALVGALESGITLKDSVRIAVDFTVKSIIRTYESGADVRYGVDFELGLGEYVRHVGALKGGISLHDISSDLEISLTAGLAAKIWSEGYRDLLSKEQIDYMVNRFQSSDAIKKAIEEGYVYCLIRSGDLDIGYVGYRMEEDRMFLSKIYVDGEHRGMGVASKCFSFLKDRCREKDLNKIYLKVKRDNVRAINAYKANGFVIVDEADTPIGDGFEMNDYILELTF
ncbi:MAG: pyridoxamine kinase [Candidatus Methanomethylophilaceae archaeon]|nr:pyridoxamine kinase [Candidatus Methanomethylophilaceae archaeon]